MLPFLKSQAGIFFYGYHHKGYHHFYGYHHKATFSKLSLGYQTVNTTFGGWYGQAVASVNETFLVY